MAYTKGVVTVETMRAREEEIKGEALGMSIGAIVAQLAYYKSRFEAYHYNLSSDADNKDLYSDLAAVALSQQAKKGKKS